MKRLTMLGLAAVAALAMAALLGAGSASATVLCKKNFKPCNPPNHYTGQIHAVLGSGSNSVIYTTSSEIIDICGETTFTGKTTNTGAQTETVEGVITALTFGECESELKAVALGQFEFHYVPGTNTLGTLTFIGTKLTAKTVFGDCVYTAGAGTNLGTFTGGTPAELDVIGTFARTEGILCPADVTFEALFEVTEPASLFIKEV